ncbi:MAG TPA: hypothetical protein VFJ17_07580 [Mycobacteriales bacterium]|jgi:hypothetical protein|nr:hypothetical protein [Mycobacteriales bacterium]
MFGSRQEVQVQRLHVEDDPRSHYLAARRRVDDAYRRMSALEARPHRPADARLAAAELTRALRAATAAAARALQVPDSMSGAAPRPGRRARTATGGAAPASGFWAAELVRLTEIGVWLRRASLDDLGVHVPASVRVGSRAANGPHIAGLVADPDDLVAATLHEPWIGVDLLEVVDGPTKGS